MELSSRWFQKLSRNPETFRTCSVEQFLIKENGWRIWQLRLLLHTHSNEHTTKITKSFALGFNIPGWRPRAFEDFWIKVIWTQEQSVSRLLFLAGLSSKATASSKWTFYSSKKVLFDDEMKEYHSIDYSCQETRFTHLPEKQTRLVEMLPVAGIKIED